MHIIDARFKIKLRKRIQFLENQNIRIASAIQRTSHKLFILKKKNHFVNLLSIAFIESSLRKKITVTKHLTLIHDMKMC